MIKFKSSQRKAGASSKNSRDLRSSAQSSGPLVASRGTSIDSSRESAPQRREQSESPSQSDQSQTERLARREERRRARQQRRKRLTLFYTWATAATFTLGALFVLRFVAQEAGKIYDSQPKKGDSTGGQGAFDQPNKPERLQRFDERVRFHRAQTKNRVQVDQSRAAVEHSGSLSQRSSRDYWDESALAVGSSESKKPAEPLVIEGEIHPRANARDRLKSGDLNDPAHSLQVSLNETQLASERESREREQFKREFLNNAARSGIKLKIDRDENVEVIAVPKIAKEKKKRRPSSSDEAEVPK